jgi:glycerol uptake facilitator-like aquaporin
MTEQHDNQPPLARRVAAEGLGSFFLFACVIGSGIMAQNLSGGNDAVALLGNTLATGAMLFVLITMLGPISGAHMNPAVSLVAASRRELGWGDALAYLAAQLAFGILGAWAAHLMFGLPTLQLSVKARHGLGQFAGEFIATFGLIVTILGTVRFRPQWVPATVGLYITAAYWFTSSTSFANPAITIARSLTNTFAGIAPDDRLEEALPGLVEGKPPGFRLCGTAPAPNPFESQRDETPHVNRAHNEGGPLWERSALLIG